MTGNRILGPRTGGFSPGSLLGMALLFAIALPSLADDIILKDGRIIALTNPHVSGDSVLIEVTVGATTGQLGYGINNIAKIQMPKPPQLQTATDLIGLGKADQAIPLLDPILAFYGPLRNIPGNWWVPAALLKSSALEDLRRENEAEPLLNDLAKLVTDPEDALLGKVRLAAIAAHRGQDKMALAVYDAALDESFDPVILAETWVDKADSLLASKDYENALLAYLHIPVFYPDQRLLMPRALLGSARAFKGMQDFKKARSSLQQLMADYAGSADSEAAKAEMKELEDPKTKNEP